MDHQKRNSGRSDDNNQDSDQEASENDASQRSVILTALEIQDARQKERERDARQQQLSQRKRPSANNSSTTTATSRKVKQQPDIHYQEQVSRHWETEFQRASAQAAAAADIIVEDDTYEMDIDIDEKGKERASTTSSLASEETRKTVRPGAFAQDGPGVESMERRNSAIEDALETLESQPTNRQAEKIQRQLPPGTETIGGNGLVAAERVDEAGPIFYAEDVQRDFFKRNRIGIVICGIVFGLIVVALSVALVTTKRGGSSRKERPSDPRCWPSNFDAANATAPLLCHCENSTKAMVDQFDRVNFDGYEAFLEILRENGVVDRNATFEKEGCAPEYQALLTLSNGRVVELTDDRIKETPQGLMIDLYIGLYIYITMNGINWFRQNGWFQTSNICGVYGVECLFVDVLSEFELSGNNLTGTIPTQIQRLQTIRNFHLSGNPGITGTIPTEVVEMSSLDSLSLHDCNLTGNIPSELGLIEHLHELELGGNRLSGTIPSELFQLSRLRTLELHNNQLEGTLPNMMEMSMLEVLSIQNNNFNGTLPVTIGNLTSLELLNIASNNFSGTIPRIISRPARLNLIDLMQSGLTGKLPESLCPLSNRSGSGKEVFRRQETRRIIVMCNSTGLCKCCSTKPSDKKSVLVKCGEDYLDVD